MACAVAILLVVVFHLARTDDFAGHQNIYWFASMGGVGVDVFFAISGFLITTLLLREWKRTGAYIAHGLFLAPRRSHPAGVRDVPRGDVGFQPCRMDSSASP